MSSTNTFSVPPVDYIGAGWIKGIQTDQQRNVFYFATNDISHLAINVGDSAEFALSGRQKIKNVSYVNEDDGYFRVFVTVENPLSPFGDGFPNRVSITVNRLDTLSITPNNYTGADWRKGILTNAQRDCFYFVTKDREHLAIKAGDSAQFAQSGRQKIQKVEFTVNDNGFFNAFITVDKALDPDGDGFPKQVLIYASEQA